jgi:hypothetical protein
MNIRYSEPSFKKYKFFLGEKEIDKESVVEADEEKGWIETRKGTLYGRVQIVNFEAYNDL